MGIQEFSGHIDQYRPLLTGFALSLTKDRDAAEDLMQETYLKALTRKDQFRPGTNLRAWLSTIMRNLFINQYRKQKRRKTEPTDLNQVDFLDTPTVDNEGVSNLTVQEIQSAIDLLEEKFRGPILLLMRGYAYEEIAEYYAAPVGTIKSRIFHARRKLQKLAKAEVLRG